ncbi:GMC family oxidoreductase, partial [Elusimicrobiota bacterium]
LLEKGGYAKPHADALSAVYSYYSDAGFVSALGNALLPIPTGVTVGGTTTINSGTCLRPPEALLKRWEAASSGAFSARGFARHVDEAWSALKVKRAPERTMSRCSRLVLEGFQSLGFRSGRTLDRCVDGCEGSGRCCFVCPISGKMTSRRAFLEIPPGGRGPIIRAGTRLLSVRPPSRAGEPVLLNVLSEGAGPERVECGALVLAAGALSTPYFIRAFGLGPEWRRAGDGLSLHPAAKVFGHFAEPVRGWEGVPQGAGVEDPEDDALRYEGVYTPPEIAGFTMPLEGSRLRWWMERYHHVATFGFMIRDQSRGSVRYPVGAGRPLIRYDMAPPDLGRMLRGIRQVARAFFAAGAGKVVLPINREGNEPCKVEDLGSAAPSDVRPRELQMMAFHPLGTCAMGRVVDGDLRACPGVYVCDGSVVPESLGVNPQITIYAFALRLAAHLLR